MQISERYLAPGFKEYQRINQKVGRIDEFYNQAYEKALKRLDIDRVNEKDFKDKYGESVEKDLEYVEEKEKKFMTSDKARDRKLEKFAIILEAIIYEQIEENYWLGEDAYTVKTARYDDIYNRVDEWVEFRLKDISKTSHLALGFDVTFGSRLDDKIKKIKDDIAEGKLSTIKYFKSDSLKFKGEKRNIPKVVIGADIRMLEEVADSWMKGENKKLVNHPLKYLIMEEILIQLRNYKDYAESVKQPEVASNIDKVLKIIEEIDGEQFRENEPADINEILSQDKVFAAIKKSLGRTRKKEIIFS